MNGLEPQGWDLKLQSDGAMLKIEQELPSDLGLLDHAVAGIVATVECAGCLRNVEKVDLAVREAVANAMIHGNRCDHSKTVRICLKWHKDRGLLIVVKDAGRGFDPNRLPNPLSSHGRMSSHGRGIFLIKSCMDDVWFRFGSGTSIFMRRYSEIDGPTKTRRRAPRHGLSRRDECRQRVPAGVP